MTALHLVRAPMNISALARWAADRGWVQGKRGHLVFDEGRALHHLLHEALGPDMFSTFRLLVPPRRNNGNLYAYSPFDADALQAAVAAHALPEQLKVLPSDQIESKPMPGKWLRGQRLGFDVRVRPVRRLRADLETPSGRFGRKSEVDAFLVDALRRHPSLANGMAAEDQTRQSIYLDWLAERLAPIAELDFSSSRLARFRRVRVARGGETPEGPDATIHGTLVVADAAKFNDLVAHGVGRHRAYGYGMLLLRPPNRPAMAY